MDVETNFAHLYRNCIIPKRRAISDSSSVPQQAQIDVKCPFPPVPFFFFLEAPWDASKSPLSEIKYLIKEEKGIKYFN